MKNLLLGLIIFGMTFVYVVEDKKGFVLPNCLGFDATLIMSEKSDSGILFTSNGVVTKLTGDRAFHWQDAGIFNCDSLEGDLPSAIIIPHTGQFDDEAWLKNFSSPK